MQFAEKEDLNCFQKNEERERKVGIRKEGETCSYFR
jgi:hypothetical protein